MPKLSTPSNKLLRALSYEDSELLRPHLEPVELERDKDLETADNLVTHAYFLDSGIASTVSRAHGVKYERRPIEVGLIGREGVTGLSLVLGDHRAIHSVFMQVGGSGQRISAKDFRNSIAASRTLHALLLKFVQVFMTQISQTAVANGYSKIEERLARLILMADDRLDNPVLSLTHEVLAMMLGVRRAGVTDAVHALASRGLIEAERGHIAITDRNGLLTSANGYYGMPERAYRRLISP